MKPELSKKPDIILYNKFQKNIDSLSIKLITKIKKYLN